VWSWWQSGSVHASAWPTLGELAPASGSQDGDAAESILNAVGDVLGRVRRTKTEAKVSQRAKVERCVVRAPAAFLASLAPGEADLREAGSIANLDRSEAEEISVVVELAAEGA
jgi:valyl-tRNA synthetase